MSAALDDVLGEAVAAGRVPGIVAMAQKGGGPVYEGASGVRALGEPAPMTLDTVFRIASMTKAVTSTAAMQLVENGSISLDTPVAEILPEWAEFKCWRVGTVTSPCCASRARRPPSAISPRTPPAPLTSF